MTEIAASAKVISSLLRDNRRSKDAGYQGGFFTLSSS